MTVLAEILAPVVVGSLLLGPLLWRLREDRRTERAQVVRAETNAALFRALGGESLVAVDVEAPSLWRPGRVLLSAPADWTWLLEPAWAGVAAHVPAGYELVIRPVAPASPPRLGEEVALRRAA
jgi:hypothetical protein